MNVQHSKPSKELYEGFFLIGAIDRMYHHYGKDKRVSKSEAIDFVRKIIEERSKKVRK